MSFKKLLALGAALLMATACSTTGDGSAISASESQVSELENKVGDRVFFEYDSSKLTDEAQETLKKQAAFMSENTDLQFTVEGHADERGTREYNMALGERRANTAKQFLLSQGVDSRRMKTVSFGKERPAVTGANEWGWGQNRRAVTKID